MSSCTECHVSLEPIRLIDATDLSMSGSARAHVDLSYAPVRADQGWFTGAVKGLLKITGMICPQCRRISLYG